MKYLVNLCIAVGSLLIGTILLGDAGGRTANSGSKLIASATAESDKPQIVANTSVAIRLLRKTANDANDLGLILEFQCHGDSVSIFNPWMEPRLPFNRSIRILVMDERGKAIRFLEDRVHSRSVDYYPNMWLELHGKGSYVGVLQRHPLPALWCDPSETPAGKNAKAPPGKTFFVQAIVCDYLTAPSVFDRSGRLIEARVAKLAREYSGREIGRSNVVKISLD